MKKKLLTGFLVVALAISGIVVMPKNVEAASATEVYYAETEKDKYNISNYWDEDKNSRKVPMKDGYVFGGWFVHDGEDYVALEEEELTNESLSSIGAVAKFVPADVLSVKTQLATEGTDAEEKAFLRLLSTTDSPDYQKVGFVYQLGSKDAVTKEMNTIYTAIKPSKTSSQILYPGSSFVDGASEYFIALDVNNISNKSYASIVYARAYWVTKDGTTVMGLARNNRVEDRLEENDYTSAGITLLTDEYAPAMVAAGKVVMTYNKDAYDVVNNGIDAGKVLSGMRWNVDDEVGTITFVGNAEIVNTNIETDGLFANVRFVNTSGEENAALNFEVNAEATAFCNWDEQPVDTVSVQ